MHLNRYAAAALLLIGIAPLSLKGFEVQVPTLVVNSGKTPAILDCIGCVKNTDDSSDDALFISFSLIPEDAALILEDIKKGYLHLPDGNNFFVEVLVDDMRVFSEHAFINISDLEKEINIPYPKKENHLSSDQFVSVRLNGLYYPSAIVIPDSALKQEPTGLNVFILNSDNIFIEKPVILGYWHAGSWTIRSGLNTGDCIAADHIKKIQNGFSLKKNSSS